MPRSRAPLNSHRKPIEHVGTARDIYQLHMRAAAQIASGIFASVIRKDLLAKPTWMFLTCPGGLSVDSDGLPGRPAGSARVSQRGDGLYVFPTNERGPLRGP